MFITFRVAGSLPKAVEARLVTEARLLKEQFRLSGDSPELVGAWKRLFKFADLNMDQSQDCRYLKQPDIAQAVVNSILKGRDLRHYILHRYCIMPNHVHLLIEPLPVDCALSDQDIIPVWPPLFYTEHGQKILQLDRHVNGLEWRAASEIMKSLKGASARNINIIRKTAGEFWSYESFDHWIRSSGEYERVVQYIDDNPVKAGLCKDPAEWRWSSAYFECNNKSMPQCVS